MEQTNKKSNGKVVAIIIILLLLIGIAVCAWAFIGGGTDKAPDDISTTPSITTNPTVTTKSSTTADHTNTVEPPVTADPTDTVEPPVTADPTDTVEPSVTTDPAVTTEPSATTDSAVTTEPSATTDSPVTTEPPATEPDIQTCSHEYSEWQTVTIATCSAEGTKTRTCSLCDRTETQSIAATGHSYGSWKVTKAAGCVTTGTETRTCSKCSGTETRSIDPTGHSYGSWTTTKKATCDTNGTQSRTCSKCSKVETQSIAATGHKWDSGKMTVVPTTCSDVGVKTYTCTACSATKTERITGTHTFGEWQWEEYEFTYEFKDDFGTTWKDPAIGHHKFHVCSKCQYKEYANITEHPHKVYDLYGGWDKYIYYKYASWTVVSQGNCITPTIERCTCTVCGYYIETSSLEEHVYSIERHTVPRSECNYEMKCTKWTCTVCGYKEYLASPTYDERDITKYKKRYSFGTDRGDFFPDNYDEFLYNYPQRGKVYENFIVDDEGYCVQFTWHIHDVDTGACIKIPVVIDEIPNAVLNGNFSDEAKQRYLDGITFPYIIPWYNYYNGKLTYGWYVKYLAGGI